MRKLFAGNLAPRSNLQTRLRGMLFTLWIFSSAGSIYKKHNLRKRLPLEKSSTFLFI
jgi:hypothetical protein